MSQVAIIGTGYVGLCTAAGFSKLGHRVMCFDVVESKIEKLQRGEVPIYEEGLQEILAEGLAKGNLSFHKELSEVAKDSEFTFICVPTPQDEDGAADLSYVLDASSKVSPLLKDGSSLVVKSTVPVGAAKRVAEAIDRPSINYVSNPEFLREGTAMWDFFNPDRIVVGSENTTAAKSVADLYCQTDVPTIVTTASSAELIKYAANSFLAIKLSFVNEVASICEQTGADIKDVATGFGLDSRIGEKFLHPGPGWGGSCFPKDTRALLSTSEAVGAPSQLVRAAVSSNNETFSRIVNRLSARFDGNLKGKNIAVWGIAFKANTDDTRESPALEIVSRLVDAGATVTAYDPIAHLPERFGTVTQTTTALEAVQSADALIVLTEWPEFRTLNAENFTSAMKTPYVFDTRRILNETWEQNSELMLVGR
jgi:UDPglucose 6-dehydrogenase